jgi:hypothetical protein
MSKYYVQSGSLRSVVEAESSRKAALWAVHQAMQQVLPIEEEEPAAGSDSHKRPEKALAVLSGKLRVSQCGFDHGDATQMITMELVSEWNQMVTTLDRLEKMLYRAA